MKEQVKYPIPRSPSLCEYLLDYPRNVAAWKKKAGYEGIENLNALLRSSGIVYGFCEPIIRKLKMN